MVVLPQDDFSGLFKFAALSSDLAQKLHKRRMDEVEVARQMGDRDRVAKLLGYTPKFENAYYMGERPTEDARLEKLKNMGKGGVADVSANMLDPETLINSGKLRADQFVKMGGKIERYTEGKAKGLIKNIDASNVDMSLLEKYRRPETLLKTGQVDPLDALHNMRRMGIGDAAGIASDPREFKGFQDAVAGQADRQKQQIKAWEKAPEIFKKKYLDAETAGGMQQQIIDGLSAAIQTGADPRRAYSKAVASLVDTGVAYRRKDAIDMLGPIGSWMSGGGSSGGPGGKLVPYTVVLKNGDKVPVRMSASASNPRLEAGRILAREGIKPNQIDSAYPSASQGLSGQQESDISDVKASMALEAHEKRIQDMYNKALGWIPSDKKAAQVTEAFSKKYPGFVFDPVSRTISRADGGSGDDAYFGGN